MRSIATLCLISLVLSACSDRGLRQLRTTSDGPDEFMIQPTKPLEAPASYSELPTPTPGQANLADRSALADGTLAFGGRPEPAGAGIPASDGALVQHASRFGVTPNIRTELAEADALFRRRRGRLTQIRIVPVDRYDQVYRREALDADATAAQWRRAGARTPSSPPAE
ncbi:MAG: DUF3035 domain-containing protein [Pseudomonadota bacterium]